MSILFKLVVNLYQLNERKRHYVVIVPKNDIGHKKICHYYSRMNVNQFHNFEPEISSDTFFSNIT